MSGKLYHDLKVAVQPPEINDDGKKGSRKVSVTYVFQISYEDRSWIIRHDFGAFQRFVKDLQQTDAIVPHLTKKGGDRLYLSHQ